MLHLLYHIQGSFARSFFSNYVQGVNYFFKLLALNLNTIAVHHHPARSGVFLCQLAQLIFSTLTAAAPRERLLAILGGKGAVHVDTLAQELELPVAELSALLVGLELLGAVRRLPGARYEAVS